MQLLCARNSLKRLIRLITLLNIFDHSVKRAWFKLYPQIPLFHIKYAITLSIKKNYVLFMEGGLFPICSQLSTLLKWARNVIFPTPVSKQRKANLGLLKSNKKTFKQIPLTPTRNAFVRVREIAACCPGKKCTMNSSKSFKQLIRNKFYSGSSRETSTNFFTR